MNIFKTWWRARRPKRESSGPTLAEIRRGLKSGDLELVDGDKAAEVRRRLAAIHAILHGYRAALRDASTENLLLAAAAIGLGTRYFGDASLAKLVGDELARRSGLPSAEDVGRADQGKYRRQDAADGTQDACATQRRASR
jgi:hypothetical protein